MKSTPVHMWTHTVEYAHCVKATPGELDREPWYRYENRTALLSMFKEVVEYDMPRAEYHVRSESGKVLSVEDTEADAVQDAIYRLMDASRKAAEEMALVGQ